MDDKRDLVLENFAVYLKLKGYTTHPMPNDTNCLFHATASVKADLYGRYVRELTPELMQLEQMKARKSIHDFIAEDPLHYVDLVNVESTNEMTDEDIRTRQLQHLNQIRDNGFSGGKECLVAVAELLKRKVIVECPLHDPQVILPTNISGPPIYLANPNKKHYNVLELPSHPVNVDTCVVALFFRENLRLKGLELIMMPRGMQNLLTTLAAAFEGSSDNFNLVRQKLQAHDKEDYKEKIIQALPTDMFMDATESQKKEIIDSYLSDLFELRIRSDDLLLHLAKLVYKKSIIILRPLESQIEYAYQEEDRNDAVFLAQHSVDHYDLVQKSTRDPTEELTLTENEEVIFVDPDIPEERGDDCNELLYIQSNVFKNLRSPIIVAFLVPIRDLKVATLDEVVQLKNKPEFLKVVAFYDENDYNKLKGDKEIRQVFTMYSHKFQWPAYGNLQSRVTRLAHFLIPPLFLTLSRATWKGIPVEAMVKYANNTFPLNLLTKSWPAVRDYVRADVQKMLSSKKEMICMGCSPECDLKDVMCHYDAKKFYKVKYDIISCVDACKLFDVFTSSEHEVPRAIEKLKGLYAAPESNDPVQDYFDYLDNSVESKSNWRTYLVMHVDGPEIESYDGKDSYYKMINDATNVKCIYAGVTTNSKFRYSHYVTSSSLSQVFSRTSRLYLLRSKKFLDPSLAKRDEAILIEIISTWLQSQSRKREKANFLFLNLQAQYMELLQDAGTSNPKIWAEFAASDIPIINTDPSDVQKFSNNVFEGNFRNPKKLKMVQGNLSSRNFEDLKDVYLVIEARQP